ncbi:VCBS repeat-containing protein [Diaphorobacter sp. HDW4B]|uniref:FG-GAP repeat domain-containing protein n=1 Tax=Diaphorobacter sp. HDW4B TaxID=2714925 RepID=UPI00140BC524|nr:VCBS repeat-containing protein [Diaphorobacter sp. HDW4B]QIL69246.1 VCBS repeat-containing protein [Diaphorobacter sp. HDW4B]
MQANGSVGIETATVDNSGANTNWATSPGDSTNNTLAFGLNDDGLWTIAANRHVYGSTDMSSYASSILGDVQGQSKSRTVVSMTSADFDRNGTSDVFGTENKSDGEYQIMWKNSGNGYAAQKQDIGDETIYWGAVIAYDKTGDGYLDLAYGDRNGNSVTYLANNGGSLVPDGNKNGDAGMTRNDQESFGEVSGVDINGDGDVDIVRHDDALGQYTLSVINNDGSGKLSVGQSVDDVFYENEKDSITAASMTWADFNGDGAMDLYLATGKDGVAGKIYYNNGSGLLSTSGVAIESTVATTRNSSCSTKTTATGFLSLAADWNHDGLMDVIKFSTYASAQTAKLYSNSGTGAWAVNVLSSSLSNVTGIAAMDYNWDGAKDLIVSQQNGKIVYVQNNQEVADGTAMHLQIVDSAGVNVYYGNTVQLHDSTGKLVAAQILNAQSGYGVNDTSGVVSFYGLDASETYTATLLKVTNGVSSNVTWDGLEASAGTNAYALSATAGTGVTSGTLTGTGYNDTFVAEAGTHTFDGSGGWSVSGDSESWSKTGGLDVVDFRDATSAVNVELGSTAVQGNAQIKATLVDIEGVAGSDYGDKLTGSAGNDWIEGRAGNDTIALTSGGKDTLAYNELNASDAVGGNGSDVVTGFKVGSWEALANTDRIDLSALLHDYKPASGGDSAAMYIDGVATINAGDTISKYLKVNTTVAGTEIQVDTHGDGVDYTTVVTLSSVQTDLATLLANHQISLV